MSQLQGHIPMNLFQILLTSPIFSRKIIVLIARKSTHAWQALIKIDAVEQEMHLF